VDGSELIGAVAPLGAMAAVSVKTRADRSIMKRQQEELKHEKLVSQGVDTGRSTARPTGRIKQVTLFEKAE